MEACQEACQNCIELLGGNAAPTMNNQPFGQGGQYAFPARTKEELQASAAQAAHAGQVSAAHVQQIQAAQQSEQALANGDLDMFAVLQKQGGFADPATQGMPPPAPTPQPAQEAPKNDGGEWLL